VILEPGSPQPGSYLAFLVRIQTVDPSAFEMPDAPANEAGIFYFRASFAASPLWHKAYVTARPVNVRFRR
jgi:hypothetical protein